MTEQAPNRTLEVWEFDGRTLQPEPLLEAVKEYLSGWMFTYTRFDTSKLPNATMSRHGGLMTAYQAADIRLVSHGTSLRYLHLPVDGAIWVPLQPIVLNGQKYWSLVYFDEGVMTIRVPQFFYQDGSQVDELHYLFERTTRLTTV